MLWKKPLVFITITFCSVFKTTVSQECYVSDPWMYHGTLSRTLSGRVCQRWDQQVPHQHDYTTLKYFPMATSLADVQNYCRSTDGSDFFWCYTTDHAVRWEKCNVIKCGTVTTSSTGSTTKTTATTSTTPTTTTSTTSRTTVWTPEPIAEPKPEKFEAVKYSSDKSGWNCSRSNGMACHSSEKLMCEEGGLVTEPRSGISCSTTWCCALSCVPQTTSAYNGTWSFTKRGYRCIYWTSTFSTFLHNYCRDPTNGGYLWCYSTAPDKRWETCGVEQCPISQATVLHTGIHLVILTSLGTLIIAFISC